MDIKGWEIDCENLPHWKQSSTASHGSAGETPMFLLESPHADLACLFYATIEVRMTTYIGALALYQNKQTPELLLGIRYVYFDPYAYFSPDGKYVFLKASYRYGKRFVLVLNLEKKTYAIVHFSPRYAGYEFDSCGDEVFEIRFDEKSLEHDARLKKFNHTKVDCPKLKWKSWEDLANGEDLNLQRRGIAHFFKSKEKIWQESLEQLKLDAMSAQEFVDLNRDKFFYYFSPFKTDQYGHTKMYGLETTDFAGQYMPIFSTLEACIDYLECRGEKQAVYKKRLKDIMAFLDSGYPMKNFGVVIDPHMEFIAIPPNVRVTPKSLRY